MEKITLDSKVVVTPKLNVSDTKSHNNPEQSGVRTGHFDKDEFPKLGGPQVYVYYMCRFICFLCFVSIGIEDL